MARAKGKGYFAGRGRYVVGVYAGLIDTRMAPDYDQPKTRAAAAGRDQARPRAGRCARRHLRRSDFLERPARGALSRKKITYWFKEPWTITKSDSHLS